MNYDFEAGEAKAGAKVAAILKASGFNKLEQLANDSELKEATRSLYKELAGPYWEEVLKTPSSERSFELAITEIETARHSVSFGVSMMATRIVAELAASSGAEGWRRTVADQVKAGGFIGALSVAGAGENELSASSGPDGSFVLDGFVKGVVNGPYASLVLVCESGGKRAFFVNTDAGGVVIGERIKTVGVTGLAVSDVKLNGVKVDKSRWLDVAGAKEAISAAVDLGLSKLCVGLSSRIFNEIKEHCSTAMLGGKPKTSDQHVRFKLAELLTQVQASEFLVYRAVWMTAGNDPEATVVAKVAKSFCSENVESVAKNAMLLAGSAALEYGGFFERASADAVHLAIAGTGAADAKTSVADSMIARYGD